MKNFKKKKTLERNTNFDFLQMDKIFPQAIELEERVLSTIIAFPESKNTTNLIRIINKPDVFYSDANKIVFEYSKAIIISDEKFDIDKLIYKLSKDDKLESIGGAYIIHELFSRAVSPYYAQEWHCYILLQKYYGREMIKICNEGMKKSYNDLEYDVFDVMEWIIKQVDSLDPVKDQQRFISMKIAVEETFSGLLAQSDKFNRLLKTGNSLFDKYVYPTANEVILLAGAKGTGKTRYIIYWIKSMLKHNSDLSVLWYAMEDPFDKIIRCMIAREVGISDTEMLGRDYKVTHDDLSIIAKQKQELLNHDIIFHNEKTHIDDIANDFRQFCKKRKDRQNVLIIDNLMQLKDHFDPKERYMMGKQNVIDEYINQVVDNIGVKTDPDRNKMIILAHHYVKKEDPSRKDKKTTGTPNDSDIRGSGRIQDSATQILMIQTATAVEQIMQDYSDYEDMLKSLFILRLVKNRNNKKAVMRFWGDMELSYYKPIKEEN